MTSDNGNNNGDVVTAKKEVVDITSLFQEAASALSVTDPMLCNKDTFNLQDSMAALELMDQKMDCCEVPASHVAPYGEAVKVSDEKMVFPRPAPIGLDDTIDPLPWNDLSIQDAAYISLESLIRLESLLGGVSVVESTFTCLYAHRPIMEDMKARLEPSSLTEKMQAIMKPKGKGTTAQHVVYASTLMLLELTDVVRSIILNADIYEEEDFTVSTYNVQVFEDRDEDTAINAVVDALGMVASLENQESDDIRAITLILGFQLDFLTVCTSLARLAGKTVRTVVEQSQSLAKVAVSKLEEILIITKSLKENEPDSIKALIQKTFDSYVNRPLVGNAPVRKIVFREAEESISLFTTMVKEIDWALCKVILKGNTLGRIRRMIEYVSISSVNILTRSLLVLNLYFDDKLFGQLNLTEVIVQNMQQLSHIPDAVFADTYAQAFLNRLAKPMYDILKVLLLNRNRQRAYIEAVMLQDWSSFRQEAHIVDMTFKKENPSLSESAPHFSLYILCITIELMDHFVVLGLELNLFCGEHELAVACWYRDFLLSSLLSQVSTMRSARMTAKQVEAQQQITANNTKPHKGKKKGGKHNRKNGNGNNPNQAPSPEDVEDEFYFLLLNLKRGLCRGIVRFLASVTQAGMVQKKTYEFTSEERIFEKRFEAFLAVQQPPPLQYNDYLQGSDFSKVPQNDLLVSTSECFNTSKAYVDKLIAQIPTMDIDFLPMQENELRRLAKVSIGNSIYVQKLRQKVDATTGKADGAVSFDVETHNQFCTMKIN